jgi:cytosine deaminase
VSLNQGDPLKPHSRTKCRPLKQIAAKRDRAASVGLGGKVTISHGFCLDGVTEQKAAEAAETMVDGVAIVTYGAGGLIMPPVEMLRDAGVLVFAGNDDIRDTWSPYGTGDPLERAAARLALVRSPVFLV